jgi:hypothetical protein
MAYIGHRCDCGHTDLSHAGDGTDTNGLGSCQKGPSATPADADAGPSPLPR